MFYQCWTSLNWVSQYLIYIALYLIYTYLYLIYTSLYLIYSALYLIYTSLYLIYTALLYISHDVLKTEYVNICWVYIRVVVLEHSLCELLPPKQHSTWFCRFNLLSHTEFPCTWTSVKTAHEHEHIIYKSVMIKISKCMTAKTRFITAKNQSITVKTRLSQQKSVNLSH